MSTSQPIALFDPTSTEKISMGTFAYVSARNRQSLYNLVIREFKKSGLSQVDLARRLGKTADVVCRFLGRPRNAELDTISEYLFAICGAALRFETHHPAAQAAPAKWHAPPLLEPAKTTGSVKEIVLLKAA